ncbi:transmembrane protein 230-like [Sturnira hondurensis]|uniref:transmembrane protein 230-like n=1 Tax=Sturnira hondurensis TaxID=192404 RepID=UPI00187A7EB7|nr:transmembrane protein 230-like [Sturnira hondurensis]
MPSHTNLAPGIPSGKAKYSGLSSTGDGYTDLQFKERPPKIPHKAIWLATVLFLIGTCLSVIGSLLLVGCISQGGSERVGAGAQTGAPVLLSGILVFPPGFSHLGIACHASKGCLGYCCDDIPGFDDQHPPQP